MNLVPLQAIPAQEITTTLNNGQLVKLRLYTRRYGQLFLDIKVNGVLEIGGVICQNLNRIIRSTYLNKAVDFAGDFLFYDTQGTSDPEYSGLGDRYQLYWVNDTEIAILTGAGR